MPVPEQRCDFDRYTSRPLYAYHEEPARRTPIINDVEVIVVGGSQSGCAAAICAARHGARVMLVERYGFLGGQSISSSVVQWEKRAFIDNFGPVATRGIAKEMLDRILAKGDSDGLWFTPPGCPEMRDGEEWLNPDAIVMTLIEMCEEAGVELLFHTAATDVIMQQTEGALPQLTGAIFENKTGRFAVKAKIVIDATADLDLVWRAIGEDGCGMREPAKRMGAGYYVWYGDVDSPRWVEYYLGRQGYRGYPDPMRFPDKVRDHIREGKLVYFFGMQEIVAQARAIGLMKPVDEALAQVDLQLRDPLYSKYVGRNRWCVGFGALQGLNHLDTWQLTRFEILRTKLGNLMLPVLRQAPGWENCYIARTNIHIGGREGRYLKAVTMVTQDRIFSPQNATAGTSPDTIGRSGGHDAGKNRLHTAYPIPYGAIVPEKLDGVLCCTRAVGAQPPVALNAHRGIVPTIVVGQAAGTAAALAIQENRQPRDVDLPALQEALRRDNVVLDVESVTYDWPLPEPGQEGTVGQIDRRE